MSNNENQFTEAEQKAYDIMSATILKKNKDIEEEHVAYVVSQMAELPAQNGNEYENALDEFVTEAEKLAKRKRHDYALQAFYFAETESYITQQKDAFTDFVVENDAADQQEIVAQFFADLANANAAKRAERCDTLDYILKEDSDEALAASIMATLNAYNQEKQVEGFDFDVFMNSFAREHGELRMQQKREQQMADQEAQLNALIDTYYEGDKEAAKKAQVYVHPQQKEQLIAFMSGLQQREEAGELSAEDKAKEVANFQKLFDSAIERDEHVAMMDPLSREFQELLEENYKGEMTEEKKAEMAQLAYPLLMKNIRENIQDDRKAKAQAAAQENGHEFNEDEFMIANAAQPVSKEEFETEAQDFVRRLKEDVAKEDLEAGLTQQYDEFAEEAKAPQREPQVGQRFKPAFGTRMVNGAITIIGAGAMGMLARTAFAMAAASTGLAGTVAAATGVLGLVALGAVGGAVAGFVGHRVARNITAFIETKRQFKELQPNGSFVKSYYADQNVRAAYKYNFAQTANKKSMFFSMALGGVIGGLVAGWTSIPALGGEATAPDGVDVNAASTGGFNIGDYLSSFLGGGEADAVAAAPDLADGAEVDPVAEGGADGAEVTDPVDETQTPDPEAVEAPAPDATEADAVDPAYDPLAELEAALAGGGDAGAVDPAADGVVDGADVTAEAGDATDATAIPTSVDAGLVSSIVEALQTDGVTAYDQSIIDRLGSDNIALQIQAAKDASYLLGGDIQMTILQNLNENFGNLFYCEDAMSNPTLAEAISQVNADLGILQIVEAMDANIADSATNADLQAAIVNLMQGAEGGNHYAERFLSIAEECFPQAFDAAQATHTDLSSTFTCAVGEAAEGGLVYEYVNCDDADVESVADSFRAEFDAAGFVDPNAPAAPTPEAEVDAVNPDLLDAGPTMEEVAEEATAGRFAFLSDWNFPSIFGGGETATATAEPVPSLADVEWGDLSEAGANGAVADGVADPAVIETGAPFAQTEVDATGILFNQTAAGAAVAETPLAEVNQFDAELAAALGVAPTPRM